MTVEEKWTAAIKQTVLSMTTQDLSLQNEVAPNRTAIMISSTIIDGMLAWGEKLRLEFATVASAAKRNAALKTQFSKLTVVYVRHSCEEITGAGKGFSLKSRHDMKSHSIAGEAPTHAANERRPRRLIQITAPESYLISAMASLAARAPSVGAS